VRTNDRHLTMTLSLRRPPAHAAGILKPFSDEGLDAKSPSPGYRRRPIPDVPAAKRATSDPRQAARRSTRAAGRGGIADAERARDSSSCWCP